MSAVTAPTSSSIGNGSGSLAIRARPCAIWASASARVGGVSTKAS